MTAIDVEGPKGALSEELQARERPSGREPLDSIVNKAFFEPIVSRDAD